MSQRILAEAEEPPFCVGVGSGPIKALTVQTWAFCAPNVPVGHGSRAVVDRGFLLILDVAVGGG